MSLATNLSAVLLTASACATLCLPTPVFSDSAPSQQTDPPQKKVAILVFNGVAMIDYSGPYEVFNHAGYNVYAVAATKHSIRSEDSPGQTTCSSVHRSQTPNTFDRAGSARIHNY